MAYRGACHFIFMLLFEPDVCIDWPHARLNCPTLEVVILEFAKELAGQQWWDSSVRKEILLCKDFMLNTTIVRNGY